MGTVEAASKLAHSRVVKHGTAGNTTSSEGSVSVLHAYRLLYPDSPRYRYKEYGILIESQEPTPPALHPSTGRVLLTDGERRPLLTPCDRVRRMNCPCASTTCQNRPTVAPAHPRKPISASTAQPRCGPTG